MRKSLQKGISHGIISVLLWSLCVICFYNMSEYNAKCPKITAKQQVTVHTGDVLTFDDLASVTAMVEEGKIIKRIYIATFDRGQLLSYVSDDSSTLYIGDKEESFDIILSATTLEEKQITVTITVE